MARKIYLIPFEDDPQKKIMLQQPKYLDKLGPTSKGIIAKETILGDLISWKVGFYLCNVLDGDFAFLDAQPDCVELIPTLRKQKLAAVAAAWGIDLSSLKGDWSVAELRPVVLDWLLENPDWDWTAWIG